MDTVKYTVMVIEDEELLLQAITKKMQVMGLGIISCTTGRQAMDYLQSMEKLPQVIWLDYYLKDTNGLDFMTALKNDPKLANIPVLVVSNSASDEKVKNMLALGVKKYILKAEYRLDDIIKIVDEIVSNKE